MILLIFGTVYAACLTILALVFLGTKPLPTSSAGARAGGRAADPGTTSSVLRSHH